MRRLVPLALCLAGCAVAEEDPAAPAGPKSALGFVVVESTEWWGGDDDASQSNVSARVLRFTRHAGVRSRDRALAERMAGLALDLPPDGACVAVEDDGELDRVTLQELGSLELLSASEVRLEADGVPVPLAVRAFPDVGASISGVFYTSEDAQLDLPSGVPYAVHLSGIARTVRAPSALEDLTLDGARLIEGDATLPASGALELSWAVPADHATGDVVVADVLAGDGSALRCTFADAGRGSLSLDALGGALSSDAEALLVVRRIRSLELGAAPEGELDGLTVRFDLAVAARLPVEAIAAPAD